MSAARRERLAFLMLVIAVLMVMGLALAPDLAHAGAPTRTTHHHALELDAGALPSD